MARNTRRGYRTGAVRRRTQFFNGRNVRWIKRNAKTGQFMDVKADNRPFKGVRKV